MTIKAEQPTMESKETSTTGNEYKHTAGSRHALITDLQRVQVLFPNPNPDLDHYRAHGKFTDEAWKSYFPTFEDFLADARVTTVIEIIWHLRQAAKLLRDMDSIEKWDSYDVEAALKNVHASLPPLDTEVQKFEAILNEMRLEAENKTQTAKGSGNEQAS